jgi:hypothetical protein
MLGIIYVGQLVRVYAIIQERYYIYLGFKLLGRIF